MFQISKFKEIPFYCYFLALSSTLIMIGVEWDISWHSSIGRDTFWSPPHIAIYLGGILAGLTAAYIVLKQTFISNDIPTVKFWGFNGPMACWITIWGTIAMLTSAPFDDWWHNAYGLDVKILSPPHVVLAMGIAAIIFGSVLSILSEQNRIKESGSSAFTLLYLYTSSLLIVMMSVLIMEDSFLNKQHSLQFYNISLTVLPIFIFALIKPSRIKWTFTIISIFYMVHRILLIWILPLFEAEPMLTPIRREINFFVPPPFPLILILPAIMIDLLRSYLKNISFFIKNIIYGISFSISFYLVQWYSSILLLSPFGRNWFFGTGKTIPYFVGKMYKDLNPESIHHGKMFRKVGDNYINDSGESVQLLQPELNDYTFWLLDRTPYGDLQILEPVTFKSFAPIIVFCIISCLLGSAIGGWLNRVKR